MFDVIPEDKLPKEFKDEERLDSLYSPFRSRSVNPRDWDTKIASWRQLIFLYCQNNQVYSFNLSELKKVFIRNGRPPSCLSEVVQELAKSGDIKYLEEFMKETAKSWSGWATDYLVKKPLSWSYHTVKRSLFFVNTTEDCIYVHVNAINEDAPKLLQAVPQKYKNKVINFEQFLQLTNKESQQAKDIKLLLRHLVRENKVDTRILNEETDSILIKVYDKVLPITDTDVAVYNLERNEQIFTKHVEELEDEIMLCIKEVKFHLLKGHKQLAKTCLKKKHEIQKRLTHKINALQNIQLLLERLKDIHYDAAVWDSYKQSIFAFNTSMKQTGLSEDAIEDTVFKLGEMFEIQQDIQSALSREIANEENNDDLEEELAELMQAEVKTPEADLSSDLDEQLGKLNISELPEIKSPKVSSQEAFHS